MIWRLLRELRDFAIEFAGSPCGVEKEPKEVEDMISKFALIIANTEYQDPSFAKLTAPGKDADEFAQVLRDRAAFDVKVLVNTGESQTSRAIAHFFADRKRDDLLLLYFSGHGVRNEQGQLFLAATDTEMKIIEASGIRADFVTQSMNTSRSQRQVLILDCCNSGAFDYGSKSALPLGQSMGMATAFEGNGFGRVVLTATDATQFAWEGDKVIGDTQKSVFTHFLIEGLKGEGDLDNDGRITVDEWYDYAYEQVITRTPKQTPGKWSYRQQGDIVLLDNLQPRSVRPLPPPVGYSQPTNQILKVFLCHSSSDKPLVRELYQQLKTEIWIDPWLDEEKLLPGQDWDMEIVKAVESADAVVVCISNKSVTKEGYIHRELRYALDIALEKPEGTIFIIPVRLDNSTVPLKLRELHWVDFFPEAQKPIAYQRLLKSLKNRAKKVDDLSIESTPPPESPVKVLESQAIRYELTGDLHNALKNYYQIKKIDPQFPRVDIKIQEFEKELKSRPVVVGESPRPRPKLDANLTIALIGLVGTLIAGLLGSPLIEKWFSPATPSSTQIIQTVNTQELRISVPTVSSSTETPSSAITPVSTNSLSVGADNMPLILISAGKFLMGSTGNEVDERPVHEIYLDAYLIDKTEVTNGMYAMCVEADRCEPPRANTSITQNDSNNSFYYGNPDFENYPVVYVSWVDAKSYCKWAGRRLPTEAEWEKAASWDDQQQAQRLYPWGNKISCTYANFYGDGKKLCVGDTTSIGTYTKGASFYGALDMAGNVWEWVADRYDPEYYGKSDSRNPAGPPSGDYIVIRGGSFLVGRAVGIRSSDRDKLSPDNASYSLGFRCAMDATP
jgi:formylglycine-generating enzyme required for sulfatase activity